MLTESYIWSLLTSEHNWDDIISRLEKLGRAKAPGLEGHHIEPERVMVVYLKPLEHLAIHIAHARREPTNSYYAKVACFVKPYPGGHVYRQHQLVYVSDELRAAVLSFGQRRPDTARSTCAKMREKVNWDDYRERMRQLGLARKGVKASDETRRRQSTTRKSAEMVECDKCGTLIKNLGGNMAQHQAGRKCVPPESYAHCCMLCGKGFLSNNTAWLTRHIMSAHA
jgi:hypothetical protein